MPSFAIRVFARCVALAGVAIAGTPYNITASYTVNNVDYFVRGWYGDGNLYIGKTVPPSVTTAFNFTIPNERADLLYIKPTTPGITAAELTFLVLNDAPGASDPLFFSHSAADLTDDDLIFWARYRNFLFVEANDHGLQSYFYLGATEVEGTYIVKWQRGGPQKSPATESDLTGANVQLTAIAPSV